MYVNLFFVDLEFQPHKFATNQLSASRYCEKDSRILPLLKDRKIIQLFQEWLLAFEGYYRGYPLLFLCNFTTLIPQLYCKVHPTV